MSELIDDIFKLKAEYQQMRDMIDLKAAGSQEIDFKPLYYPRLLEIRKDLSCLSLDLAKSTSIFMREFKTKEAKRKTQYFLSKRNHIAKGMKIGAAESEAEVECSGLRIEEATAEGNYGAGRLILNQVNEIIKSLNQDISIIKKEYESINQIS